MDLRPATYNWPCVTQGDTYPAQNITIAGTDAALSRVRVKVKLAGTNTTALTLDSNSTGVTINSASAGSWDFDIDAISATSTAGLTDGSYVYDLETTDENGTVRTYFKGGWEILPQTTD